MSAKGNELWVINKAQQIFRWMGTSWKQIPGGAVRVGASPDGWSWVVNGAGNIFRFNVDTQAFEQIPGGLVQINAISKDSAIGVNGADNIFLWVNNAWKQLPGAATWAAIGDGDERWVINRQQQIFRWNHQQDTWEQIPGGATYVDVQNKDRVIVTNAGQNMFVFKNGGWHVLTGGCIRATLNEEKFFCVNGADQLFKGEFNDAHCPRQNNPLPQPSVTATDHHGHGGHHHDIDTSRDVVVIYREEEA
jgi:hypothetical protein